MIRISTEIILAAGLSSRLKPLTDEIPKCLTEINGQPILLKTSKVLEQNGITKTIIAISYLGQIIIDHPVGFSKESVKKMKLSMFAKIPAYMISDNPTLVCGPSDIAAIEYANIYDWAYEFPEENKDILKNTLLKLIENNNLRIEISRRPQDLTTKHHDTGNICNKFREELCGVPDKKNINFHKFD